MPIRFVVKNVPAVKKYIKTIARGGAKVGFKAFVDYIIGDGGHGLRRDEPQKYVSRQKAGYKTSHAQMAYFFAVGILENIGGKIVLHHYKRTGKTAAGYKATITAGGYGATIENSKPGAYWTRGEPGQTTQHAMAGRRTISKVIADNLKGAIRSANARVRAFLSSSK